MSPYQDLDNKPKDAAKCILLTDNMQQIALVYSSGEAKHNNKIKLVLESNPPSPPKIDVKLWLDKCGISGGKLNGLNRSNMNSWSWKSL